MPSTRSAIVPKIERRKTVRTKVSQRSPLFLTLLRRKPKWAEGGERTKPRHTTRRLSRAALRFALPAVLIVTGFGVLQSGVLAQPLEARTIVAFREAKSDAFVAGFVTQHDVRVEAVYLAKNGFSGAHRDAGLSAAPRSLVAAARTETIETFANVLRGNEVRLQKFVDSYSRTEIVASSELATRARSLLTLRSQAQSVLDAARSGEPLIYAIEVRGAGHNQLAEISRRPDIHAVQTNDGRGAGPIKPAVLEIQFHDASIDALDAGEIRDKMLQILVGGK